MKRLYTAGSVVAALSMLGILLSAQPPAPAAGGRGGRGASGGGRGGAAGGDPAGIMGGAPVLPFTDAAAPRCTTPQISCPGFNVGIPQGDYNVSLRSKEDIALPNPYNRDETWMKIPKEKESWVRPAPSISTRTASPSGSRDAAR